MAHIQEGSQLDYQKRCKGYQSFIYLPASCKYHSKIAQLCSCAVTCESPIISSPKRMILGHLLLTFLGLMPTITVCPD